MGDDVGDLGQAHLDLVLDGMADAVAVFDGEVRVDLDVDVHEVSEADFFHAELFDAEDAGDSGGGGAGGFEEGGIGGAIEIFMEGLPEEMDAIECDDGATGERGDVVRFFKTGTSDECDDDADEGGGGGDRIGAMVPGVSFQGSAGSLVAFLQGVAGERFLDDDDEGEHGKGEPGGRLVAVDDVLRALDGDDSAGGEKGGGGEEGAELLGAAFSEMVAFVGGLAGDAERDEDDHGGEQVVQGLDAIGDERVGISDDAGDDFHGSQKGVHEHAFDHCPGGGCEMCFHARAGNDGSMLKGAQWKRPRGAISRSIANKLTRG